MSANFTIDGIGSVPSNVAEYTSGSVVKAYLESINIIAEIFNRRSSNPNSSDSPLSDTDFDNLIAAMNKLRDLAKNGVTDGNPPLTFYLTAEMATNLDLVFKSLKAAGIVLDVTYPSGKTTLLESWQSLAGFGVQQIMNAATSVSTSSTRTLQSMVELEYVKQGNDLLAVKFQALEQSLKTTQGILDTLALIQGISNQVTITNKGDFAFPPTNNWQIPSTAVAQIQQAFNQIANGQDSSDLINRMRNFQTTYNNDIATAKQNAAANGTTFSTEFSKLTNASKIMNDVVLHEWTKSEGSGKDSSTENMKIEYYTKIYKVVASAQFTQVFPVATPTSTAATELLAAKQKLYQRLVDLEAISPANTRSVEGTLASMIFKVVQDISSAFLGLDASTATPEQLKTAVSKWIIDNQDQKISSQAGNNVGSIQDRITQAITAAQSLNDTEKENVRNYQFVFQQFYQSASTVLQKVTQIVEKLAQGISR
ncbi:hypothetical protein [Candidatus Protochlamydia amoebophila]|nr:hypothetical protein [Candidatus Protochlamydia amoebophila]